MAKYTVILTTGALSSIDGDAALIAYLNMNYDKISSVVRYEETCIKITTLGCHGCDGRKCTVCNKINR